MAKAMRKFIPRDKKHDLPAIKLKDFVIINGIYVPKAIAPDVMKRMKR